MFGHCRYCRHFEFVYLRHCRHLFWFRRGRFVGGVNVLDFVILIVFGMSSIQAGARSSHFDLLTCAAACARHVRDMCARFRARVRESMSECKSARVREC